MIADRDLQGTFKNPYPMYELLPWRLSLHRGKDGQYFVIDAGYDMAITPDCSTPKEAWAVAVQREKEHRDEILTDWRKRVRAELSEQKAVQNG